MAQGQLIRAAAAAAVLALGAAAELAAPTGGLTAADFAVGAGLGCGGAWLIPKRTGYLVLLTAALWFLGTLSASSNLTLSAIGSACLLLYRGPLLQVLPATTRPLAVAAWIAGALPLAVGGPATAAVAGATAVLALAKARGAAADERRLLLATGAAAGALGTIWALAALATDAPTALALLNDAAVLAAGLLAISAATGTWAREAAGALVVQLGPATTDRPITAQLARALGDPTLEIRYALPGIGWVDERGRSTPAPEAAMRARAPGGGEVALLHGATAHPRLLEAATAAAALAFDAARLDAEIRARAVDLQHSRRRVLTAADAERRLLEARLTAGPLARLQRVDALLTDGARDELAAAMTELVTIARGLYPPARNLEEITRRSPVPTTLHTRGDLTALPDDQRAAIWFCCSEALANVARHARATSATVTLTVDADIHLEVRDDGHGGATATRGLRGLRDRLEALGGKLDISSPAGGPTVISCRLPAPSRTSSGW